MKKDIITIDAIQAQPTARQLKHSTFKVTVLTALIGFSVMAGAFKMLKVLETGHDITFENMFKSIDQLMATEENERKIYAQRAYNHYSQNFASAKAVKLAMADTESYFKARKREREDDQRLAENLIDETAESMHNGSTVQRLVSFLDRPNVNQNNAYAEAPLPNRQGEAFEQEAHILKVRSSWKPSLPVAGSPKAKIFDKCKKANEKTKKKLGCPPPNQFNLR